MSIRTKFALGLFIILLVNLDVGLYGLYLYKQAIARASAISERTYEIVTSSFLAQVHFKKQVQEWKNVLLRGQDSDQFEQYFQQFEDEEHRTRAAIRRLVPLLAEEPEARKTAEQFLEAHVRLGSEYRKALTLYRRDQPNPHRVVDIEVRGVDRRPTDLLDEVVASAQEYKETRLTQIGASLKRLENLILLLVVGVMTGTIVLAIWLIDRTVGRPIGAATAVARRISEGNLVGPIEVKGGDEPAQLLKALIIMQENLARSQDTLRRSEERTRLLLESSGQGIYGVDTHGRCVFCNPAAASMLGYTDSAGLVGADMHARMHHSRPDGSPYPKEKCPVTRTYRDGKSGYADNDVFWRADGTSFPVEYRTHPVYHDSKLLGSVVNFADISARKQGEAALRAAHSALEKERAQLAGRVRERTAELNRANAELEHISRSKDEFLAAMSHELRTPLTTVIGIAETMEDQLLGPLNEQQTRAARTVRESGNHLLSLINDILDVAKVESGKMAISWDSVPVQQLCDASLQLVRQPAQRKKLNVTLSIDPDVRLVRGDGRRLKQMLLNLLSNAVKFTPEGGSIGLEVAGEAADGRVRISVWDTGIGVPEHQHDKLFKPFVQLDSKLSRQYSGTGLGLALVYGMADLHGGEVKIQSKVGKGSRFDVLLPWDPKVQDTAIPEEQPLLIPEEDPELKPEGEIRILLAEDNEPNAEMLASYLKSAGYQVVVASNGTMAVAMAKEHRPDLILMDIQMPEMDGLEATRSLRANPRFHTTPIIALTALAMPGDRARCLEAGMDEYLSKPVGLKELHNTLRGWIQRSGS